MKVDRVFGATMAILSLLFLVFAVPSIPIQQELGMQSYSVSPRFFPYAAGGTCLLLSVLIVLRPSGRNALAMLKGGPERRNVLAALGIAVGYGVLLNPLGFILSSALSLLVYFVVFGERRWFVIAPLAVGVPLATEFVFVKLFLLEVPSGIFGIGL